MHYATGSKCNYCDACMGEYCGCKLGRIKETEPTCDSKAVIPSVTVETVDGITNLANCLVHVVKNNTTYYVDDKHRIMITWAGPVNIPGYDMEGNPNKYKDQIVTDTENETAVIYDNHGKGYLFGITSENLQEAVNNKLDEMIEDGTFAEVVGDYLIKKLDYYLIDNTTSESDIQDILDIERAKVIEFEDGTYSFTNTLRLNSNTKLILNNAVINSGDRHLFYNFKDTDTSVTGYNGAHNIEIIGGKINGGISFIHGKNIKFENIYFYHVKNDHCIEICGCQNVVVDACEFEGVVTQTNDRQYVENVQIENANHTSFPWLASGSATYDETACNAVEIKNCNFKQTNIITYRFYAGIGNHSNTPGYSHTQISIHDNTIIDPIYIGIRMVNVVGLDIYNNTIKETDVLNPDGDDCFGIRLSYMIKECNIHDNVIDGFTDQQLFIDDRSANVTVRNNTFKNMPKNLLDGTTECNAIKCGHVDNLVIDSNMFINELGCILYNRGGGEATSSNITFTNNIMTAPEGSDLYAYRCRIYACDKLIFVNNTFNEYPTTGSRVIRLHSSLQSVFIKGTKVSALYNNMIDLNGFTGTLSDVYGIYFRGYTGNETNTFTNQTLSYDYTQFNTMLITIGTTGDTRVLKAKPWAIVEKLDARTFEFPITTRTSTVVPFTATLNSDGTISTSEAPANIRLVYFINE